MFIKLILCLVACFGVLSCTAVQQNAESCPYERPTVCTREYAPVCAVRGDEHTTYATACTACADERVSAYTQGACKGDAE